MTVTINAVTSTGLVQTSDGSGVIKLQSNGVATNALAWVKFAGASGAIASSYNVSSVTRTGTGTYTVAYTSALADANYAVVSGSNYLAGSTNASWVTYYSPTTTNVLLALVNAAGSFVDAFSVSITIFGN